ncbi:hypothetical protein ACFFLZ_15320 [Photobacterium aphoticum]|uniref:Lipoprotein n=1 Tax=Photobacterium aphoticum TaxID=754436 RepID=A0A0J1GKH8_9GAMM|nr:hypothetical protein [Photobacterium aphoticum]KLV00151.1 hypothetical protein ABT58_14280 [Photobacterium aphoticum]PSU57186.1 hypothetical protein C9I90_10335 [Photobacterium aphoticum]GHA66867.1 hypothetical protein GCM10007086_45440 [Photobacterium aphoticum]
MKLLPFLGLIALLTGCISSAPYSDEALYDVASTLKDITQAVDGEIKFGDTDNLTHAQIIDNALAADPSLLDKLKPYQWQLAIQGDHAVMLLCDDDIALMEDAGCNAQFDNAYWQQPKPDSCRIQLQAQEVCQ